MYIYEFLCVLRSLIKWKACIYLADDDAAAETMLNIHALYNIMRDDDFPYI